MTAVPGRLSYIFTVQDAHGDVAVTRMNSNLEDVSINTATVTALYTASQTLGSALAACMNGKIVKEGWAIDFNRAQKPTGPLGTYAHVYQSVDLNFGDGGLERTRLSIPTPLTTDMLADGITADPSDANVSALIAAFEANIHAASGNPFNEYLGGRFREGKPRRRTNLYNGVA